MLIDIQNFVHWTSPTLRELSNNPTSFQGEYYPYVYYKMNIDMVGAQNSVLGS